MENVAPSRTLFRRSRQLIEVGFLVITASVFITIVGIALFVVPLTPPTETASFGTVNLIRNVLFLGGLAMGALGVALVVRALTWRTDNDLALKTGQLLSAHLSDQYTFIRNVSKRQIGYVDAVLVGPAGLLVFRIVDFEGDLLNETEYWMRRNRRGEYVPTLTNPTREVIRDIKALRDYLAEHDLHNLPIYGVVVLVKDDPVAQLTIKDPVLPATHLTSLPRRLQHNYLADENRIDARTIRAVVRLLYGE